MKNNMFVKKNKLYFNIILTISLTVFITILLISSILYLNFENTAENMINKYSNESLSQISYSATIMKDTAKTMATQLYFNPSVSELINLKPTDGLTSIHMLFSQISYYRNATPNIHSIYFYNGKNKTFCMSSWTPPSISKAINFPDKEAIEIINNYKKYKRLYPIPREAVLSNRTGGNSNTSYTLKYPVYSFLFYQTQDSGLPLDNAIIINISEKWLQNVVKSIDKDNDSNILAIDSQGNITLGNENFKMPANISGLDFIKKILHSGKESGYFKHNINGKDFLVTFVSSDSIDWKFIRLTDYAQIILRVKDMRFKTLVFAIAFLLVGMCMAWILSRNLYNPINKLENKIEHLQHEVTKNKYEQKQNLIKNLILNDDRSQTGSISENLRNLGISLRIDMPIVLVLMKIDNHHEFSSKNTTSDKDLFKFAILNISQELFSARFICETTDMGSDNLVAVLNVDIDNLDELQEVLDQILCQLQLLIKQHFDISVSCTVSSLKNTAGELYTLYGDCLEYSSYRLFEGHSSVIYTDKVNKLNMDGYTYPVQTEKLLIDSLLSGKLEQAEQLYKKIISETESYHYHVLHETLLRLTYAMKSSFEVNVNAKTASFLSNLILFTQELSYYETLEQISKKFLSLFEQICTDVSQESQENPNSRYSDLLKRLVELVNENYSDVNLSIETLSAEVDMSPVYLGRIFKKHMGSKSVADYIAEIRISKAKELLALPEPSVHEIAAKVGFSNINYFFTIFKKQNGVTPGEYRNIQITKNKHQV